MTSYVYGAPPPQPQYAPQPQPVAYAPPPPVVYASPSQHLRDWRHGMFGCFDNFGLCMLAFCCPCHVLGKNAQKMSGGDSGTYFLWTVLYCLVPLVCHWPIQCYWRMKIKQTLGIRESDFNSVLLTFCCAWCTLCQEAQELEDIHAVHHGGPYRYHMARE